MIRAADTAGASADVAILVCAENNHTGPQAVRLVKSLREFGGAWAAKPVYAFSPRPDHVLDDRRAAELSELKVQVVTEPLRRSEHASGVGNKPVVASWAEANLGHAGYLVADSDGLFLDEPAELEQLTVPAAAPVWAVGAGTRGAGDPAEGLWRVLHGTSSLPAPTMRTRVTGELIRPYFNSGFVFSGQAHGLFGEWADEYARLERSEQINSLLRPAGTDALRRKFSPAFFVDQLALAVVLRKQPAHLVLSDRYNIPMQYPLHEPQSPPPGFPVYAQYNAYWAAPFLQHILALHPGLPDDRAEWMAKNIPPFGDLGAGPGWPPDFLQHFEATMSAWRTALLRHQEDSLGEH